MSNWFGLALLFAFWSSAYPLARAVDYPVTNILDSLTEGSIRAALVRAEASGVPTRIIYSDSGSISLGEPLVLRSNVWLDLPGAVITGGGGAGAFLIWSNANVRLSGITVSNVVTLTNAAVLNEGTLLMENCVLDSNSSSIGRGGAIHNRGNLTITRSKIIRNSSRGENQILGLRDFGSPNGAGGGIHHERGLLSLYDSVVQSNKTSPSGISVPAPVDSIVGFGVSVGAGVYGGTGTIVLARTSIADNYADQPAHTAVDGGGIYLANGQLLATNCTILRNRVVGAPARLLFGSPIPGGDSNGGGIAVKGGKAILTHCTIAENSSLGGTTVQFSAPGTGRGGGVYVDGGEVQLRACILVANEAEQGKDFSGLFLDLGGNILGTSESSAPLNPSSVIRLPALSAPSGTLYYQLPPSSRARDIITSPAGEDILLNPRPIGNFSDAGSIEGEPILPTIVSSIPDQIVLTPGSSESIGISAIGTRELTYELLSGELVVRSGTNSVFTFSGAEAVGLYRARVTNMFGNVESQPFEVLFNPHLTFVEQPASKMVNAGGTAQFRAVLTGEPPMSFQWFKDGAAIPGATNSFIEISNVQREDLGLYNVRVSNAVEEVNSQAASLAFWPVLRVTNLGEWGVGSLRWAIEEANLTPEAELRTIVIATSGTVRLGNPLVIRSHVEIENPSNFLTLSGGFATRLFRVESNALAQIRNLVLVDGKAPSGEAGGAIWSNGRLELTGCSLSNHTAALGGGIYNSGDMTLRDCVFSNNVARGENGQSGNGAGGGGGGLGGAIYSMQGNVMLTNVILQANTAQGGKGGAFDRYGEPGKGGNEGARVIGTNSVPYGVGGGGGFETSYISPGRPPVEYYLHHSGHPAGVGGGGGGARGGSTAAMGGYFQFGPASEPGFGGGEGLAPAAGGGAGLGGALFVQVGTVHIFNSKVVANVTTGGFGFTNGLGIGGGIFVHAGRVRISDSVVFGNNADSSPDFYGNIESGGGNLFSTSPAILDPSDQVGIRLSISMKNEDFEVRWPNFLPTFALERTFSITASRWEPEPSLSIVTGEDYVVSKSASAVSEFFRLRQATTSTNSQNDGIIAPKTLSGRIQLENLQPIPFPEVLTFVSGRNFLSDRRSSASGPYTYRATGNIGTLHLDYTTPADLADLSWDLSLYFTTPKEGIFRGHFRRHNVDTETIGTFKLF